MTEPIPLLTVDEAAAQLRVCRMTVYRLIWRRLIKPTKVGRLTRIRATELERFLDRHTREKR